MIELYRFDVAYLDEERGIKHMPCDDGDYVLAEDALALQATITELEAENTRITIKYNANRIATEDVKERLSIDIGVLKNQLKDALRNV